MVQTRSAIRRDRSRSRLTTNQRVFVDSGRSFPITNTHLNFDQCEKLPFNLKTYGVVFNRFRFASPSERETRIFASDNIEMDFESNYKLSMIAPNELWKNSRVVLTRLCRNDSRNLNLSHDSLDVIIQYGNTLPHSERLREVARTESDEKIIRIMEGGISSQVIGHRLFDVPSKILESMARRPDQQLAVYLNLQQDFPNKVDERAKILNVNDDRMFTNMIIKCQDNLKPVSLEANNAILMSKSSKMHNAFEKMFIKEGWGVTDHIDTSVRPMRFLDCSKFEKFAVQEVLNFCHDKPFNLLNFNATQCIEIYKVAKDLGIDSLVPQILSRLNFFAYLGQESVIDLLVFANSQRLFPLEELARKTLVRFEHSIRGCDKWNNILASRHSFIMNCVVSTRL